MRTTINIEDGLLSQAKRRAVERGTTLTRVFEDALRESLQRRDQADGDGDADAFATLTYRGGGLAPGADLDDGAGLRELLGDDGAWSSQTSTS